MISPFMTFFPIENLVAGSRSLVSPSGDDLDHVMTNKNILWDLGLLFFTLGF